MLFQLLAGCSVSRKTRNVKPEADKANPDVGILEAVRKNNVSDFDFIIQNADISLTENENEKRLIATIKYKKPDTLLISIRTKVGLEAVRFFITADTILINDRINKQFLYGDPEYINLKYGIEPDLLFVILGDFLTERLEEVVDGNCLNGVYEKDFATKNRRVKYSIDCRRKKIVSAFFKDTLRTEGVILNFKNFFKVGKILLPGNIEIENSTDSTKISIVVKKIELNWKGKIKFISGNNYKSIELR